VADKNDGDVELTMVTMTFDASDPGRLQSILAHYVVISRGHPGCRNIDLALSSTTPNRFVIIQKWESPEAQRAHFDSPEMVAMASSCDGILAGPPRIDLLEPISAHDLT
jgi:quinol monooxygenase YgiN